MLLTLYTQIIYIFIIHIHTQTIMKYVLHHLTQSDFTNRRKNKNNFKIHVQK